MSVAATLCGCAQLAPAVPDDYKGHVFYVQSINDNPVQSALIATRQASQNRGFALSLHSEMRRVPVAPLKLKLVASHVTAAPLSTKLPAEPPQGG